MQPRHPQLVPTTAELRGEGGGQRGDPVIPELEGVRDEGEAVAPVPGSRNSAFLKSCIARATIS